MPNTLFENPKFLWLLLALTQYVHANCYYISVTFNLTTIPPVLAMCHTGTLVLCSFDTSHLESFLLNVLLLFSPK